jgi:hypothetical protein
MPYLWRDEDQGRRGTEMGTFAPRLMLLERVSVAESVEQFGLALVAGLGEVISADVVAYNEVDLSRLRAYPLTSPAEAAFPGSEAALERNVEDHPLVGHHRSSGDRVAATLSDYLTLPRLRATGLYSELFRPLARGWTHEQLAGRYHEAKRRGGQQPECDQDHLIRRPIAMLASAIPACASLSVAIHEMHVLPAPEPSRSGTSCSTTRRTTAQ